MVRIMLEDIATSPLEAEELENWQKVLASLDSLPVGYRSDLGRLLLDSLSAFRDTDPETVKWQARTFFAGPAEDQLGFVVCSTLSEQTRAAFSAWLELRHHERGETADLSDLTSIGVLLTPRSDGYRDWDTTVLAVSGDLKLTDDELSRYRAVWNPDE
ncbi:hypothetical protein [Kitasatospora sp. NPDC088783]|uniref:hypothetical protein n=1 Tax=Kitasatospora sp. NPDC088783 TaxID=3364077 RepID=UPI00382E2A12